MRKKLKFSCIAMSFVMVLSIFANAASNQDVSNYSIVNSKHPSEVPKVILEYISNNGISFSEDSIITVEKTNNPNRSYRSDSSEAQQESYVIQVTNYEGETGTTDFLIASGKDDPNAVTTRSTSITWPPASWTDDIVMHGTAKFVVRKNLVPYYQPQGCTLSYSSSKNITFVSFLYGLEGNEYSYPGFQSLGTQFEYATTALKYNPRPNTTYSSSRYYRTDRVLKPYGSDGHYVTFTYQVNNGQYTSGTIRLAA